MLLKNFLVDELQITKGAVKMPIKSLIESYRDRYEEMSKDRTRPFQHTTYRTVPGNRLMVHVKVPSRSLPKFYYDVLLELSPSDKAVDFGDCHVKIFSNSPSFVYTYAYVFYHLDVGDKSPAKKRKSRTGMIIDTFTNKIPRDRLLMPGTEKKLGGKVLGNEPSTRNPLGLPYLDSSIYLAIFYLQDVTTLAQVMAEKNYRTEAQILSSIPDFDRLMASRKKEAAKVKKETERKRKADESTVRKAEKAIRKPGATLVKPKAPVRPTTAAAATRVTTARGLKKPTHIGGAPHR